MSHEAVPGRPPGAMEPNVSLKPVCAGARHGAIATTDGKGEPQDFVTRGLTEEEHRKRVEWPDGPRLFEYFRDFPGPPRLADVPDYVRSLGFSPDLLPLRTSQGTPMRHFGAHAGNFFVVEKEGGEAFTDEEVLVLFASQAATARRALPRPSGPGTPRYSS